MLFHSTNECYMIVSPGGERAIEVGVRNGSQTLMTLNNN